jgi:adenylate kinase
MQKRLLLFLGAPGSGKGTLAQRCVKDLSYDQLSTGNLCREHIAHGTEIGKSIDLALKSGKLIDDGLVTCMVTEWLAQNHANIHVILDGYPRTVVQAEAFDKFIDLQEQQPLIVRLKISERAVIDRLTLRLVCSDKGCQAVYSLVDGSGCQPKCEDICDLCESPLIKRADDEIEAIKYRLKLYSTHEQQLLDFYNAQGYEIIDLDAVQPTEAIFCEFKQRVHG